MIVTRAGLSHQIVRLYLTYTLLLLQGSGFNGESSKHYIMVGHLRRTSLLTTISVIILHVTIHA